MVPLYNGMHMHSRDAETVRINISMEKEEAEQMKSIAAEYYGGNVSRLIRAAVNAKVQELNGLGIAELKKKKKKCEARWTR